MSRFSIASIRPETAHSLRQSLLHADQPLAFSIYPADEAVTTLHVGAFAGRTLAGIASVYHESPPAEANAGAWRLRDIAVTASMRRRGCGSALLRACIDHAVANGGTMFWCNVRPAALPFYRAHGFRTHGEAFDMPGFGLRHRMWRSVGAAGDPAADRRRSDARAPQD